MRYTLQSNLKISIGTLFALSVSKFGDSTIGNVNMILNILMVVSIVALPLFYAILLHRNRDNLTKPALRDKIGSLYLEMSVQTASQRLFTPLFLIRRLMYAVITVGFFNAPYCLIHSFMLMNTINTIYVGHAQPHLTKLSLLMEFYNEAFLQMVCYHIAIIPLTLTTSDEEKIGWVIIALILFVLLSNLGLMISQVLTKLKRKLYLRKLRA